MKLLMLKGLPGSGKSTYARELAKNGYVRVNKDDLRAMLNDGKWSKTNEKFVIAVRNAIVTNALAEGKSVVVDDTNFSERHRSFLSQLAKDMDATFETKFFDVPLEECIKRDLKRANSVGEKVIRQMHDQFLRVKETYEPPTDLPMVAIFDLDGTLALMSGRSPYDWTKVDEDQINEPVARTLEILKENLEIVILSGRDSVCREATEKWLKYNCIPFKELFMRAEGDMRKDSIVKRELFEEHIRERYDVQCVFDDRDQVVKMWRDMGLPCFQVAEGDF